jgi:dipeptidyl aminopeptidase/acylaminoacyl peptidase
MRGNQVCAPLITASYGSWKSPISSSIATSGGLDFETPIILDEGNIYWVESRPDEAGRSVVVRWSPKGGAVDITPAPFNARTTVHEYGGGAFTVESGVVYFSNFIDQRLYRQHPNSKPKAMTPQTALRYADAIVDHRRRRIVCVCEDHSDSEQGVVNSLVAIGLDEGGFTQRLISGNDFYSSPRISPDGSHLAWLTWNKPSMPWDSAELWTGEITGDGSINRAVRAAGGFGESVCHPLFSPDNVLYFVSEQTGWLNLYRWKEGHTEPLHKMEAEFGVPLWVFGTSTYGFDSSRRIICTYNQGSRWFMASLDTQDLKLQTIKLPYTYIYSLQVVPGYAAFIGASPTEAVAAIRYDLETGRTQVLRHSAKVDVGAGYLSVPRAIEFPTENGLTAHAFFYPPRNQDFRGPSGERPPLIVVSHGGPTSATSSRLNLFKQYWTSRGFAVADVNYGGSTGYGSEYRRRLDNQWGIVDVDDCVNCARYLVKSDEVDANRTIIRGESAGGYTTLAALTFRDFFKAGASYFGVSDLGALARDTHKFESRYLDSLVGPYPDRRDIYMERSPINYVQRLSCPVIFFQGSEDKIVPPNQAETMVNALRKKEVPVAYILFQGEQHGFLKAENLKRSLEAELYFYSRIFHFDLADSIEPVPIENL